MASSGVLSITEAGTRGISTLMMSCSGPRTRTNWRLVRPGLRGVLRMRSSGVNLEQRTLETIARSRALLEGSGERLKRREAAVRRSQARRGRQQAEAGRASGETERDLAAWLPDPSQPIERSQALRQQAITAIEALAENEEEIARIHKELAASRPGRRDEYRKLAQPAGTRRRPPCPRDPARIHQLIRTRRRQSHRHLPHPQRRPRWANAHMAAVWNQRDHALTHEGRPGPAGVMPWPPLSPSGSLSEVSDFARPACCRSAAAASRWAAASR